MANRAPVTDKKKFHLEVGVQVGGGHCYNDDNSIDNDNDGGSHS